MTCDCERQDAQACFLHEYPWVIKGGACQCHCHGPVPLSKAVVFWTCTDPEELQHEDLVEALEEDQLSFHTDYWGRVVIVEGYARRPVSDQLLSNLAWRVCDAVTSTLEDDCLPPADGSTWEKKHLEPAVRKFVAELMSTYDSYWCDQVCTVEVDLMLYIALNDVLPWLEEDDDD